MSQIGVSSVAFRSPEEARVFYEKEGIPLEYGVNLSPIDVDYLMVNKVKCISLHIPSPTRGFFPNFATGDRKVYKESMDILNESMETLSKCGGGTLVLHPGYAEDALLPSDYKNRKPFIERGINEFKDYIIDKDGAVTGLSYLKSLSYKRHWKLLMENIGLVSEFVEDQGFHLAIENLNPRLYYLLQLPDEMVTLARISENIYFCLDFGHLFISSLVNGFDFEKGINKILSTGRVIHFHLSNNPSRIGYYNDAHNSILKGNIDYSKLLPKIREVQANFIVEIKSDPREDIAFLKKGLKREISM